MDLHTYALFVLASIVLVVVPGPDMVFLVSRSVAQGRKAGLLAALGINAGAYVHLAAAVLGLSAVLATSSVAFTAVKWLGACYLVYLGLQAVLSRSGPLSLQQGAPGGRRGRTIFWQGFLSDVLNPKVAVFFLAFLPQFIAPDSPNPTVQLLLLGVTVNGIALAANVLLVAFAATLTSRLRGNPAVGRWLSKAMGGMFIYLGYRLATDKT